MLTWVKLILQALTLINKLLNFLKIWKARKEGREEVITQVNKDTEKLKDEFKKIDNSNTSFDDAIDSLRSSSNKVSNGGASKPNSSNS